MVACLGIVAGSVLFGVFGPGIAQRSMLSGGVALGDLVTAAAAQRDALLWRALDGERLRPDPSAPSLAEPAPDDGATSSESRLPSEITDAARARARQLGFEATIPDLSNQGYALVTWGATSLGGTHDDAIALGYLDRTRDAFVALYLAPDEGRFVIFDSFGRAVPLMPDRLIAEDIPSMTRDDGMALVWSSGPVLSIAIVDSPEEALSLRGSLGAP